MVGELESKFDSFYRANADPWDYWKSQYEIDKYGHQLALARTLVSARSVLEIGCSTGSHTRLILEAFPAAQVTAIDISSLAIERAKANLDATGRVRFLAQDIFAAVADFSPDSFDLIFWSEGFDYLHSHCTIARFSELCRQLATSLTNDGVLCVSHILPDPLTFPLLEAGSKNVAVFHTLLKDYFARVLHTEARSYKEETGRSYRYGIDILRPRLLGITESCQPGVKIGEVDIVIPARDEQETIAAVVESMSNCSRVKRIFVIDNGSADGTADAALAAGATVIACPSRGYGRAVKRGIAEADSSWIFKIDADIENPDPAWLEALVDVAEASGSSLVKACWAPTLEDPDRVTNFTVRPAFEIFFPELCSLRSPLSGVYLLERAAFEWGRLPSDFAFDVALLIAQLERRQPACEVEITSVRHASVDNGRRTYDHYHRMSSEILRYIVGVGLARVQ